MTSGEEGDAPPGPLPWPHLLQAASRSPAEIGVINAALARAVELLKANSPPELAHGEAVAFVREGLTGMVHSLTDPQISKLMQGSLGSVADVLQFVTAATEGLLLVLALDPVSEVSAAPLGLLADLTKDAYQNVAVLGASIPERLQAFEAFATVDSGALRLMATMARGAPTMAMHAHVVVVARSLQSGKNLFGAAAPPGGMTRLCTKEAVTELVRALFARILTMTVDELRVTTYDGLNRTADELEWVLLTVMSFFDNSEYIYRHRFALCMKAIRCPLLEYRLQGIKELEALCQRAHEHNVPAELTKVHWITHATMWGMVDEASLVGELLGGRLHSQVLRRTDRFFRFLVAARKFDASMLHLLWNAANGKHETEVQAVYDKVGLVIAAGDEETAAAHRAAMVAAAAPAVPLAPAMPLPAAMPLPPPASLPPATSLPPPAAPAAISMSSHQPPAQARPPTPPPKTPPPPPYDAAPDVLLLLRETYIVPETAGPHGATAEALPSPLRKLITQLLQLLCNRHSFGGAHLTDAFVAFTLDLLADLQRPTSHTTQWLAHIAVAAGQRVPRVYSTILTTCLDRISTRSGASKYAVLLRLALNAVIPSTQPPEDLCAAVVAVNATTPVADVLLADLVEGGGAPHLELALMERGMILHQLCLVKVGAAPPLVRVRPHLACLWEARGSPRDTLLDLWSVAVRQGSATLSTEEDFGAMMDMVLSCLRAPAVATLTPSACARVKVFLEQAALRAAAATVAAPAAGGGGPPPAAALLYTAGLDVPYAPVVWDALPDASDDAAKQLIHFLTSVCLDRQHGVAEARHALAAEVFARLRRGAVTPAFVPRLMLLLHHAVSAAASLEALPLRSLHACYHARLLAQGFPVRVRELLEDTSVYGYGGEAIRGAANLAAFHTLQQQWPTTLHVVTTSHDRVVALCRAAAELLAVRDLTHAGVMHAVEVCAVEHEYEGVGFGGVPAAVPPSTAVSKLKDVQLVVAGEATVSATATPVAPDTPAAPARDDDAHSWVDAEVFVSPALSAGRGQDMGAHVVDTHAYLDALLGLQGAPAEGTPATLPPPNADTAWDVLRHLPPALSALEKLAAPGKVDWVGVVACADQPQSVYLMHCVMVYLRPPLDPDAWPSPLSPSGWRGEFVRHALGPLLGFVVGETTAVGGGSPTHLRRQLVAAVVHVVAAVMEYRGEPGAPLAAAGVDAAALVHRVVDGVEAVVPVVRWLWREVCYHMQTLMVRAGAHFEDDAALPASKKRGREEAPPGDRRREAAAHEARFAAVFVQDCCHLLRLLGDAMPPGDLPSCLDETQVTQLAANLVTAGAAAATTEGDNRTSVVECLAAYVQASAEVAARARSACLHLLPRLIPSGPHYDVPADASHFMRLLRAALSQAVPGDDAATAVTLLTRCLEAAVDLAAAQVDCLPECCRAVLRVPTLQAPTNGVSHGDMPEGGGGGDQPEAGGGGDGDLDLDPPGAMVTYARAAPRPTLCALVSGVVGALQAVMEVCPPPAAECEALCELLLQSALFDVVTPVLVDPVGRQAALAAVVAALRVCCAEGPAAAERVVAHMRRLVALLPFDVAPAGGRVAPWRVESPPAAVVAAYDTMPPFEWQPCPRSAATGYAGLDNQGATCYMNALLQQLYMIPRLRVGVLASGTAPDLGDARHKPQLLTLRRELQTVFGMLAFTQRRAYDPRPFVMACDDKPVGFLPLDSHVLHQNDANEFYSLLLDRLASAFPPAPAANGTPPPAAPTPPDMFTSVLGGKLVHQLIPQGCAHSSARAEDFMCVSLDIADKGTLAESLDAFVKGEMLSGDNAYRCGPCDKKVDTLKRCCFQEVPPTLVLHLKRFELDFETFRKKKINSRLDFPMELDLWPYTADGMAEAEAAAAAASAAGGGHRGPMLSPRGATPAKPPQAPTLTPDGCKYVLKGVIVHHGTADSGHYYSFIEQRADDPAIPAGGPQWMQFNDAQVSKFKASSLAAATHGGPLPPSARRRATRHGDKEHNAFMLFYDRVDVAAAAAAAATAAGRQPEAGAGLPSPPSRPHKRQRSVMSDGESASLRARLRAEARRQGTPMPARVASAVTRENMQFWLEQHLLPVGTSAFMSNMARVVAPVAGPPLRTALADLLFAQLFTLDLRVHHAALASGPSPAFVTVGSLAALMAPTTPHIDQHAAAGTIVPIDGAVNLDVCEVVAACLASRQHYELWQVLVGVPHAAAAHRHLLAVLVQCLAQAADGFVADHVALLPDTGRDVDDPLAGLLPPRPRVLLAPPPPPAQGVPPDTGLDVMAAAVADPAGVGAQAGAAPGSGGEGEGGGEVAAAAAAPAVVPPPSPTEGDKQCPVEPTCDAHRALLCLDVLAHAMALLVVPALQKWHCFRGFWAALEAVARQSTAAVYLLKRYDVLAYTLAALRAFDANGQLKYQGDAAMGFNLVPVPRLGRSRAAAPVTPVFSAFVALVLGCRVQDMAADAGLELGVRPPAPLQGVVDDDDSQTDLESGGEDEVVAPLPLPPPQPALAPDSDVSPYATTPPTGFLPPYLPDAVWLDLLSEEHLSVVTALIICDQRIAPGAAALLQHLSWNNPGNTTIIARKLVRVLGPTPLQPPEYLQGRYHEMLLAFLRTSDALEASRVENTLTRMVDAVLLSVREHRRPTGANSEYVLTDVCEVLQYAVATVYQMEAAAVVVPAVRAWLEDAGAQVRIRAVAVLHRFANAADSVLPYSRPTFTASDHALFSKVAELVAAAPESAFARFTEGMLTAGLAGHMTGLFGEDDDDPTRMQDNSDDDTRDGSVREDDDLEHMP